MSVRQKIPIFIIVNENSPTTRIIIGHVGKYITELNKEFKVEIIKVNAKNAKIIREMGVTAAPTLVRGGKKIEGVENIVKALTPVKDRKMGFGMGYDNPEEALHDMMLQTMGRPEEDDKDEEEDRGEVIRRKMAEFQKKRPQMSDTVPSDARIPGGRVVVNKPPPKFGDSDEGFLSASGRDNITDTPTNESAFTDMDGAMALEEWYLDEANSMGKKAKTPRIKGSAM